jgi:hypothetical protein
MKYLKIRKRDSLIGEELSFELTDEKILDGSEYVKLEKL